MNEFFIVLFLWSILSGGMFHPMTKQEKETLCLALNIYKESRGESLEGQHAVLHVTMGRARDNLVEFGGSDLCKVVFHKTIRPTDGKMVEEFSWTEGEIILPRDKKAWRRALKVARRGIKGKIPVPPKLVGARYFINEAAAGEGGRCFFRGLVKVATIGSHDYYKKPRTLGEAVQALRGREYCLANLSSSKKNTPARKQKKKRFAKRT